MSRDFAFRPVRRNVFPAPIPYIFTEKDLPTNQKLLVFLPHSDDGRYFGCSLHLMNRNNDIRIVIISPGYRGVDAPVDREDKIRMRWQEALNWAGVLGFNKEQLVNFRADRTYNNQKIHGEDQKRLCALFEQENPTAVFLPHISDTAQAINYNTRRIVLKAALRRLRTRAGENRNAESLLLFEYPTNHVPLLPPSDKNFMVFFTDPQTAQVKHKSNLAHLSQSEACFDIQGKFAEAMMAISEADTIHQASKRRHLSECLSGVEVNPHTSRGEHFGVTKVTVFPEKRAIVERRILFPLSEEDKRLWTGQRD
ncbi:PIG-L family deacetylase [bacterium]|nr:PIG-L family deacetylase [bacterium]